MKNENYPSEQTPMAKRNINKLNSISNQRNTN